MKNLILSLILFSNIFSCTNNNKTQEKVAIDTIAIELNDAAASLAMHYSSNKDSLWKAIRLLDEAISIDSSYIIAYGNKSLYLNIIGETSLALDVILEALKINPENPYILTTKGIINEKLGRVDSAKVAYNRAIIFFDAKIKNKPDAWKLQLDRVFTLFLANNNADNALNELTSCKNKFKNDQEAVVQFDFMIEMISQFNRKEFISNYN